MVGSWAAGIEDGGETVNKPKTEKKCPECGGRKWIYGDPCPVCMHKAERL